MGHVVDGGQVLQRGLAAGALQRRAPSGVDLYEQQARRILEDTEKALDKAGALLGWCCGGGLLSRVFTIVPTGSFKRTNYLLDNSIGNLSWVLHVSNNNNEQDDDDQIRIGLPPITQNESIMFLIWKQIAVLQTGGLDARAAAATSMASLARDMISLACGGSACD